jgi:RHS repeat-associated protein
VPEWLHRDGLASNRLMTDAAGTRVQHSHYLPYGDRSGPLTVDENGGPVAPERIGERGDLDTNLLCLNARWYDPALGRFLTPDSWDPTIPGVGTNHYACAGNDPGRDSAGLDQAGYSRAIPKMTGTSRAPCRTRTISIPLSIGR